MTLKTTTVLIWAAIFAILCQNVSGGGSHQMQHQVETLSLMECPFCLTDFDRHDCKFLKFKTCKHGSCKQCLANWLEILTSTNMFGNYWYMLKCAFCSNQLSEHDLVLIAQEMIEKKSFNASVALRSILDYANFQHYNNLTTVISNYFEQNIEIERAVNKTRRWQIHTIHWRALEPIQPIQPIEPNHLSVAFECFWIFLTCVFLWIVMSIPHRD